MTDDDSGAPSTASIESAEFAFKRESLGTPLGKEVEGGDDD